MNNTEYSITGGNINFVIRPGLELPSVTEGASIKVFEAVIDALSDLNKSY